MATYREAIRIDTKPGVQAIDVTDRVEAAVAKSRVRDGLVCIFTPSSTSAILTNELEPGLMTEDIPNALERLFPQGLEYGHQRRWQDGNGHSHVRATFLGPSLTAMCARPSWARASQSRSSTAGPPSAHGNRSRSWSWTTSRGIGM